MIVHEFFVGTEADQAEHAREMADHGGGGGHDHSNAAGVAAGESERLTMTFEKPRRLLVGCHEPGHYEAGMRGTITIVG